LKAKLAAAILVLVLGALVIMAFKVPTNKKRSAAIGSVSKLSKTLQLALDPADFLPMNKPGPHDWLANHEEFGQTFDDYVQEGFVTPDKTRKKIYLLPIGPFAKGKSPSKKQLQQFTAAYFSMPVVVLDEIPVEGHKFTTRINAYTKKRQILTHDILKLLRKKLPKDGFCILAITMEDLYPESDWNFVFGMASLYARVGVFSFARYDPAFFGQPRGKGYQKTLLRRSCKVLAHEAAHMFGLLHCIFFQCLVNGSNHMQESDSRPIHLCPVCLRKLQYNIEFDVVKRYQKLLVFYKQAGMQVEAKWVTSRLEKLTAK
jgi:archaemetzincin